MNTVSAAGLALSFAGVVGYLVGVVAPFPGRALSLTALMTGVTLLAVGRSDSSEAEP